MVDGPVPQGMAGAASSPDTDPETLRQIAFHFPELRPAVAANPAAYQGLLDWLGALGDPAVNEALAVRERGGPDTDPTTLLPAQDGRPVDAPVYAPAASHEPTSGVDAVMAGMSADPGHGGRGGETPAQGLASQEPQPRGRSTKGLKIALGTLIVVALALTALVIAIFNGLLGGESEPSGASASPTPTGTQDSPTPQESQSEDTSPSPTASPSVTQVLFPPPDGAQQVQSVVTPSGNIACSLGEDTVTCLIIDQNYEANGFDNCGTSPTVLSAGADDAGLACGTTVAKGGASLEYGSAATYGQSACVSSDAGMSCWNTISGKGFALARQGWQAGSSGQISPDAYRW